MTYEKGDITGYQRIYFNFNNSAKPYSINHSNKNSIDCYESNDFRIKNARVYYSPSMLMNYLFISGTHPFVISLIENKNEQEIKPKYFLDKPLDDHHQYTIIIKETSSDNSFYLLIKELYIIILIKPKSTSLSIFSQINNTISENSYNHYNSFNDKKYSLNHSDVLKLIISNLNKEYMIHDVFAMNINGEIISCQLNEIKTLMLINSTDRVLRLFRIVEDSITFIKDYSDSVNKKRWLNCSFYTYKIKSGIQDLIITGLCDSNSLEFAFIDIETGRIFKKLEPFKYSVQDFVCHYKNHFTILIISNKKLFSIIGYMVNPWGCFAPGLKYIEDNIEFIEDESFFDSFEHKMKNNIHEPYNEGENIAKKFRENRKKQKLTRKNLFFKYSPKEDDQLTLQCKNDLKELFSFMNESFIE